MTPIPKTMRCMDCGVDVSLDPVIMEAERQSVIDKIQAQHPDYPRDRIIVDLKQVRCIKCQKEFLERQKRLNTKPSYIG